MGSTNSKKVPKDATPPQSNDATDASFKLPLVDFASFSNPGSASVTVAQRQTAEEINEANRTNGFVCLRNSGISKDKIQSAFQASRDLFAMENTYKQQQLKKIDPTSNTGYVGYGDEALNQNRRTDLKEAFNVRKMSQVNGDFVGTPESFQNITMDLWKEMQHLATSYSICCALALGLERDYFSKTLEHMELCTLRMLHYPPCGEDNITLDGSKPVLDTNCAIRVGEHTDFGIFTFLFIHDFAYDSSLGLQVKQPGGGENNGSTNNSEWKSIVFDQETLDVIDKDDTAALIVNTGALVERWTNDLWTATAHRVIVSPKAFSSHRYSMAMFLDPDKETVCSVHDSFVKEGEEAKYEDITSIDYLLMRLNEAQGVKG